MKGELTFMKKIYLIFMFLSVILMADKIGTTGPDGTIIITDPSGPSTIIFK